jgi:hypothetical protein
LAWAADRPEDLERRAKRLEGRLTELDAKLMNDPRVRNFPALAAPVQEESRRLTDPLILELTVLALRLDEYRRTGRLPADIPHRERLKRFLDDPWPKGIYPWAPTPLRLPFLELDVLALEKQLRTRWIPQPAAPLPPAVSASPRQAPSAPGPELVRDAGTGLPPVDPIPELIALLSSADAYQRSLAADELGKHGKAAARAVPALRKALSDADPRVRGSAALSLGSVGEIPSDIVGEVRRLLQDSDSDVRFSAKAALKRLESP